MFDDPASTALYQFFNLYLGPDWPEDYGSLDAAIAAYRADVDPDERARAVAELERLAAAMLPANELLAVLDRLGNNYQPDDPATFVERLHAALAA